MSPEQRWRHNELRRQRNCDRGPALSGELCDATRLRATDLLKPPPHVCGALHAARAQRLGRETKQVPAATRRGKNDTLKYLYDLAPGEARPVEGIRCSGRSL